MTIWTPADHGILIVCVTVLRLQCFLLMRSAFISGLDITRAPYHVDYDQLRVERGEKMKQYGIRLHGSDVHRRRDLRKEEFVDLYDGKWPVILTDIVPDWPAFHWTKEFLLKNYGNEAVIIATIQGGLWNASGASGRLADFVTRLNDAQMNHWVYIEDEVFLFQHPELLQNIDQSLYPPGQDALMYVQHDRRCGYPLECIKYNSEVDAFDGASVRAHPLLSEAQFLEVEQKPGEMLVIPPGWFHQAYNPEETLAVSSQYMNEQNHLIIIEEIIKAGNLHRSQLPEDFMHLAPKDQVLTIISLLSPDLLIQGKKVTEQVLKQIHAEL